MGHNTRFHTKKVNICWVLLYPFVCSRRGEGRRQWHPTPVVLPGKSHGWRSLVGCSPWGRYESDTTERLHFDFSLSCIGEGNGNPLQCSCLENPRDGGAWWAAAYGVACKPVFPFSAAVFRLHSAHRVSKPSGQVATRLSASINSSCEHTVKGPWWMTSWHWVSSEYFVSHL